MCIYTYILKSITESLCCPAEIYTALWINYSSHFCVFVWCDLTQQKFISCSYNVHYRSGGLSRTDTSLQCGGLSIPDCSDLILLSLDVLTRQRRKTALESPTPTNKCFSHEMRILQQPTAQNCLRTLSNHKEQKRITTPFFFWLCHVAYRIPVPWSKAEPGPSVVKAWSPNHWITRKFPSYCSLGSKRHVSLSTAIPHLEEDLGTSLWNNTSTLEKTTFLKRKREKGVSVYIHVYIYAYTHVIYMYIK